VVLCGEWGAMFIIQRLALEVAPALWGVEAEVERGERAVSAAGPVPRT
jgi:hypothetical protein